MKNDEIAAFDVVNILEFDDQNKIQNLKIIYDTVISRAIKERLYADSE